MRFEPDILMGVAVPVFALSLSGAQTVRAWNEGMARVTGVSTSHAVGRPAGAVFGAGAEVLQAEKGSSAVFMNGLGTVQISLQGDLLVGTVSDAERDAFIGLAARDLRAPLRTIHQLADDAIRDGFAAEAALTRIKRIAREGMTMTLDVVSCAEAGGVVASRFRKVAMAPLCHALLDSLGAQAPRSLEVPPITVIAEKALMQAALRRLFEHVLQLGDSKDMAIAVEVTSASEGFSVGVSYAGPDLQVSKRRFLDGGAFHGDEGYGLLGLRRLVRSRGGRIATTDAVGTGRVRIELTLPGCVLKPDITKSDRQELP